MNPKTDPKRASEAQLAAGWTRPPTYIGESKTKAQIAEEARVTGQRRRRIEDILEASRIEQHVLSEVWE